MNIENQVCTFEQAKRLKELGVSYPDGKESFFKWFECDNGENWEPGLFRPDSGEFDYMLISGLGGDFSDEVETRGNWNAFTVAELGVMLPDYYPSWRFLYGEGNKERRWVTTVIAGPKPPHVDDIHTLHEFDRYGLTQAESMATLLIALLETEAIKVDEVNQRLQNA